MSDVQRICARCGHSNPLESRYCAHCGDDSRTNLPAAQSNLPMVIGRAALPVLATVAGYALRVGWRLLQHRLARAATAPSTVSSSAPMKTAPASPASSNVPARVVKTPASRANRRTIHIRSKWAVSNGRGGWQEGISEHTIEMDD